MKRFMPMRQWMPIVCCLLASPSALHAQVTPQAAGKTFQTQCLSCHQPPDLTLATDRAWLDQIKRTA